MGRVAQGGQAKAERGRGQGTRAGQGRGEISSSRHVTKVFLVDLERLVRVSFPLALEAGIFLSAGFRPDRLEQ